MNTRTIDVSKKAVFHRISSFNDVRCIYVELRALMVYAGVAGLAPTLFLQATTRSERSGKHSTSLRAKTQN